MSANDDYVRPDLPRPAFADDDYPRPSRRDLDPDRQRIRDEEQLRILAILYYVFGGLSVLCASTPIIHVVIGVLLACGVMSQDPGDRTVGFFMAPIASAIVLIGWLFSAGVIFSGRCLGRRTRYPFCFVMACLCCANIPLGTVLGVFTIIVLARPGVRELFDVGAAERGAAPEQGSRMGGEEIQPFPPTSI